jgi:DNA mismatch endonuclease (patch repair protein)
MRKLGGAHAHWTGCEPLTDVFSPEKRSAVMRRVKGRDTAPELTVRKLLWRLGARYRLHRKDLPGKPDIALPGRKLAIFVHGCFWHGHDCARGARVPKANRDYWLGKVARNRARDMETRAKLEAMGWRVLVFWECGLKDEAGLEAELAAALAVKTPPRPAPSPPPSRSSA